MLCQENIHRLLTTLVFIAMLIVFVRIEKRLSIAQSVIQQQAALSQRQDKTEKVLHNWEWYINNVLERAEAKR